MYSVVFSFVPNSDGVFALFVPIPPEEITHEVIFCPLCVSPTLGILAIASSINALFPLPPARLEFLSKS